MDSAALKRNYQVPSDLNLRERGGDYVYLDGDAGTLDNLYVLWVLLTPPNHLVVDADVFFDPYKLPGEP